MEPFLLIFDTLNKMKPACLQSVFLTTRLGGSISHSFLIEHILRVSQAYFSGLFRILQTRFRREGELGVSAQRVMILVHVCHSEGIGVKYLLDTCRSDIFIKNVSYFDRSWLINEALFSITNQIGVQCHHWIVVTYTMKSKQCRMS